MPPIEYPDDCKNGAEAIARIKRVQTLRIVGAEPQPMPQPKPFRAVAPKPATVVFDPLPQLPPVIKMDAIIDAAAEYFHISRIELLSPRRGNSVCFARHIVMYLATKLKTWSLPRIGTALGNRDHTTILYGRDKIADLLIIEDPDTRHAIDALTEFLVEGKKNFPELPPPSPRDFKHWSAKEKQKLKRLWKQGIPTLLIAKIMRRTPTALQKYASRHKIKRPVEL